MDGDYTVKEKGRNTTYFHGSVYGETNELRRAGISILDYDPALRQIHDQGELEFLAQDSSQERTAQKLLQDLVSLRKRHGRA